MDRGIGIMGISRPIVSEIAWRTWCIDEFGMDALFLLEGSEKALLIDTGTGLFDIPALVAELTDKPLIVALTHGHVDHIYNLPEIAARNPNVRIYCTKTPYQTLRRRGVPKDNLRKIRYGQSWLVNGVLIHALHGRHAVLPKASPLLALEMLRSPHRGNLPFLLREHLRCPENDETVFYQIEADGKSAAVMGSLNLREEVDYPQNMDLLILPYNGWTDNYPPAVQVIERLKPKRVLLDHFDESFPPFTRSVDLKPLLEKYPGRVRPMKLDITEQV